MMRINCLAKHKRGKNCSIFATSNLVEWRHPAVALPLGPELNMVIATVDRL
jgi:hypothetical protein